MLLKRYFNKPEGCEPRRDTRGRLVNPPPLDRIEVLHTGVSADQHISTRVVDAGLAEGWISIGQGKLTLHAKPEALVFTIKRLPGYYCCHCGAALADAGQVLADGSTKGLAHVREEHPNATSPDPGNPSGYERINHYDLVLDAKQHKRYKADPKQAALMMSEARRQLRAKGGA